MKNLGVFGRYKIRAPFEFLRVKYRKANHIVEYFTSHVRNKLLKFDGFINGQEVEDIEISDIDELIKSIEEYVVKLVKVETVLSLITENIQSRVDMLKPFIEIEADLSSNLPLIPKFAKLYQHYFACELLDRGFIETARLYISINNLKILVDIEFFLYNRMVEIERDLQHGKIDSCVKWCKEQKTLLKKNTSIVFFKIRIYEFSQLIKNNRLIEAIQYASKYFLSPPSFAQKMIEEALCLLAYNNQPSFVLSSYFSPSFLEDIIKDFRKEYKIINGLNNGHSDFGCLMQYGLMAVRTRSCDKTLDRAIDCPSCNPLFKELARALPYPTRPASFVKCRVTNKFYSSDKDLYTTPEGHVYSSEGINAILTRSTNSFICPQSGTSYRYDEVHRIYIAA